MLTLSRDGGRAASGRNPWLEIEEPVDRGAMGGATFEQFASLLWNGSGRPVVFATSGYGASHRPGPSEPAADRASATAAVRRRAGLEAVAALSAGEVPAHDPRALLEGERGISALR